MIAMDHSRMFGAALLRKFKELIETSGELKLMAGSPSYDTTKLLATLPASSLNLEVEGYQLRMASTAAPKFTVLRPGIIAWWMLDCRQPDVENAPDNGYIQGDVSFTDSSSVQRAAAELQLNTLLISAGDGGALSEITPIQFSIQLG